MNIDRVRAMTDRVPPQGPAMPGVLIRRLRAEVEACREIHRIALARFAGLNATTSRWTQDVAARAELEFAGAGARMAYEHLLEAEQRLHDAEVAAR